MRFVISINLNCTLACSEHLFTKTHLEACFCINILPLHYFLTNVLGKMNEDFYVHLKIFTCTYLKSDHKLHRFETCNGIFIENALW